MNYLLSTWSRLLPRKMINDTKTSTYERTHFCLAPQQLSNSRTAYIYTLLIILSSLFFLPTYSDANSSYFGHAAITTDHRAYGVSLTQKDPAVQIHAGIDVGNGLYAGTFLSTFNFIDDSSPYDAGENLETDLYAGYRYGFSKEVVLSMTLYQYLIQGTNKGINLDFTELIFDLYSPYGQLSFSHTLNDILGDLSQDKAYRVEYNKSIPIWDTSLTLDLQLGHWNTQDALGKAYLYYNLGLSIPIGPIMACVAYNGTDKAGKELFGEIAKGSYYAKVTWVF
ncbi:TorF family putative porin [Shewanella sp. D64]|uniref:TorF family putative porin n=1 Tax=unclassified Shewanella TaxID=196818 RepID=UPI0022BA1DBE|nr:MULTISPECIES: TorF family putative porin [unclassified Shewanella]MEC4728444.1 TorF family putative porin [Shewanella sp. D64]MEC4740458.1 TorF family putative porin [Shewanella sp. E94]WBJ94018.1 TorF family putative porin [Shewanella sp. MTB7]